MKETQHQAQEPTEQHSQTQAKKQKKFKGRLVLKPGHKVWEVNLLIGTIEEAKYESANVVFDRGKTRTVKNLVEHEDCIYIPALNKKNAQRKFNDIVNRVKNKI